MRSSRQCEQLAALQLRFCVCKTANQQTATTPAGDGSSSTLQTANCLLLLHISWQPALSCYLACHLGVPIVPIVHQHTYYLNCSG
jgi:hypothetical protein